MAVDNCNVFTVTLLAFALLAVEVASSVRVMLTGVKFWFPELYMGRTTELPAPRSQMLLHLCVALIVGIADGFVPLAGNAMLRRGIPILPVSQRSTGLRSGRRAIPRSMLSMNAAAQKGFSDVVWSQTVREDMEAMGATYCILWQRKGDDFVVAKDYTTEARRKAMRRVRGDDKLFATESRRYKLPASGSGPIATAARMNQQVTIKDTSSMQRAALAKEFGIKKIHFVPVADGVLEYGTPSSEEMVLIELLALTVRQMWTAGSVRRFFRLAGEVLFCLRLLIAVEENNLVAGLSKAGVSFLSKVNELEQESVASGSKSSISSKISGLLLRALVTILAPVAWMVSFVLDKQNERQKRRQQQAGQDPESQEIMMRNVFAEADKDGNGVLR